MYDTHLIATTSFDLPILIVGNLSVGGTGKTPQVEYLVRLLRKENSVAILSRGYKRKSKGYHLLTPSSTFLDSGDEPMQYYKKFPNIAVAVDVNRVSGVQKLIKNYNPQVIILDDAFQHRKIKGSFYILLTAYHDLFTNDYLLPAGNLREGRSSALRSDIIIVTKCPKNLSYFEMEHIRESLQSYQDRIYFTTIRYETFTQGAKKINIQELKQFKVLLITGIAKPKDLLNYMNDNGIQVKHLEFPDHHNFSDRDLEKIKKEKKKLGEHGFLLTTEKDYIRLHQLDDLSYIGIKTEFLNDTHQDFDDLLLKHVHKFSY